MDLMVLWIILGFIVILVLGFLILAFIFFKYSYRKKVDKIFNNAVKTIMETGKSAANKDTLAENRIKIKEIMDEEPKLQYLNKRETTEYEETVS